MQPETARKLKPNEENFHHYKTRARGQNSSLLSLKVDISEVILQGFSKDPGRMKSHFPSVMISSKFHLYWLFHFPVLCFLIHHSCPLRSLPKIYYLNTSPCHKLYFVGGSQKKETSGFGKQALGVGFGNWTIQQAH